MNADQLEKDLEKRLVRKVRALGGRCLKWTSPSNSGVPDRLVLLPEGRIAFVEMKKQDGRVRKLQQYWLNTLTELGFQCATVFNEQELDALIHRLEGEKNGV